MEDVITFIRGYSREYRDLTDNLQHPRPLHVLVTTATMAEAIAVLHGIQFASEWVLRRLFWRDVKVWAGSFSGYCFEFTVRQGNSVAHALAEEGMRRLEDCFWVEDAPMEAKELADVDRRFQQPL
ncbi:hypothetical protein Gotri_010996 [Gossypium trilobum]|uniref:RNase H type-1 domain-containing protein n=1 Tax=Gossypium trilobum TaxID=34281 RepID=A0A7J9ESR5_9ROSI|nr:hypothetical protein [Gossypium trilobum]